MSSKVTVQEPKDDPQVETTTTTTNQDNEKATVEDVEMKDGHQEEERRTTSTQSIIDSANRMDLEEDDYVIHEIPVYMSQELANNLFLFQYPLRQPWRPYDMQKLQQLRIKPHQQKVEMDLSFDTNSEYFNENADPEEKYTLSSTTFTHRNNYAIGVLKNDELHLTPLQSILQLRPSFQKVDKNYEEDKAKKKKDREEDEDAEGDGEEEEKQPISYRKPSAKQMAQQPANLLKKLEDEEAWIPLESIDDRTNENSIKYFNKLITNKNERIVYDLNAEQYLESLCPKTQEEWVPKASHLQETTSLETIYNSKDWKQQIKGIIMNGCVMTFSKIYSMIKTQPLPFEQEVIAGLEEVAFLINGRWVVKSDLVIKDKYLEVARDYLLLMFYEGTPVERKQLVEHAHVTTEQARDMLSKVGTLDVVTRIWSLKSEYDHDFMSRFPNHTDLSHQFFVTNKSQILKRVKEVSRPSANSVLGIVAKDMDSSNQKQDQPLAVPDDYREGKTLDQQLLYFLHNVFKKYGVCNLQKIKTSLSETFEDKDSRNLLSRTKVTDKMVSEFLGKIARELYQQYFLKSLGMPQVDKYRDIIIEAFSKKMIVKMSELSEAIIKKIGVDAPGEIKSKILNELAYSKGTSWIFKVGTQ